MKELEQWEKTQFILAGYKTLCARCRQVPVEKETSGNRMGLANHCNACWIGNCYKGTHGVCDHASPVILCETKHAV